VKKLNGKINLYRDTSPQVLALYGGAGDDTCGVFRVPQGLMAVASSGGGWDHVSASRKDRCPTWEEMCRVKDLFFNDDEWAVQYHPPRKANINAHPYCLHLWRPQGIEIPTPPEWMV
jgi:hypothetical protein